MFEEYNSIIYEILKKSGLLSEEQLNYFEQRIHQSESIIAEEVINNNLIELNSLLKIIAQYLGYDFIENIPQDIDTKILESVKPDVARMYRILPISQDATSITFLAKDPFNFSIIDDLSFSLKKNIHIQVSNPDKIEQRIIEIYGDETYSLNNILSEIDQDLVDKVDISDNKALTNLANDTPIIKLVNMILEQAIHDKASDIHFEPFEKEFRIRYRIDGALYEMSPPPLKLALPIISRIKVLSDMNVSENRIPQDGRIKMTVSGRPVDLRVSTLPTQFGESLVLRILDKSVVNLDLNQLNMPSNIIDNIRKVVFKPNGIFIVTGPTGSGKTTTLYSALRELNQPDVKILTAEEPIEYEIEGIMQVAVNHSVGLDFANALRSFLRQDPDKIMVGEIRDRETAQIAVQASLTGHVVLSTLHTNDAPGAVTRLIDMGLDPFLIAGSLESVLGQRLMRRIDPNHRVPYEPETKLVEMLNVDPLEVADKDFYYGEPHPDNNNTGYKGRIGIYEMFSVTDSIRELISDKAPTLVLKQRAIEEGMNPLRDDGIRAIFDGATTIEEVLKYT